MEASARNSLRLRDYSNHVSRTPDRWKFQSIQSGDLPTVIGKEFGVWFQIHTSVAARYQRHREDFTGPVY